MWLAGRLSFLADEMPESNAGEYAKKLVKADDEMATSLPTGTLRRDFEPALLDRLHSAKVGFILIPGYEIATTCLHANPVDG